MTVTDGSGVRKHVYQYDASGNLTLDGRYLHLYDPENRLTEVRKPIPPTQNLNNFAAYTKGGDAPWVADPYGFAKSGNIDDGYENGQESWMYINVQGPGTVRFKWKVSSQQWSDYLEFYVDDIQRYSISGECDWRDDGPFTVTGTGPHQLKWRYAKNYEFSEGEDCGYVKDVNFTPPPPPLP